MTYILLGDLMKKVVHGIMLLLLTFFSFFYTDKVMEMINSKDPLMLELVNSKMVYDVLPVDAILEDDTIIPGINGREVDLDKSYDGMKNGGVFREEFLVFRDIFPADTLSNNNDKYIIKGNGLNKEISIIVILKDNYIDIINDIDNITVFVNHKDINVKNINLLKDKEIYTYGNNGIYDEELLVNDNALINRLSNNTSIFCLVKNKNKNILDLCNKNDMYVVIPNIVGGYYEIKNNLSNGSIILIDNLNDIDVIIKYIKSKGYNIVTLGDLVRE